jgi:hypothetical protein
MTAAATALLTTALLAGTVAGTLFAMVAYRMPRDTLRILAVTLIVTALIYVGFALAAGASAVWLVVELAGVILYGGAALRGLRRSSPTWLSAGWLLHPVWDVTHHLSTTAHASMPSWYAAACLGFDVAVGAVIAIRTVRGARTLQRGPTTVQSHAPLPR